MSADDAAPLEVDWNVIVRDHGRRVLVSVLALGLPLAQAEDVVQETWARLYERWKTGQLARVEMPGLAIVQARFLAVDALRRAAATHRAESVSVPVSGPAALPAPDEQILQRADLVRALAVLDASTPAARAIVVAITGDPPKRHDVIAKELGLSTQRVRQILWETRERLRAAWRTP